MLCLSRRTHDESVCVARSTLRRSSEPSSRGLRKKKGLSDDALESAKREQREERTEEHHNMVQTELQKMYAPSYLAYLRMPRREPLRKGSFKTMVLAPLKLDRCDPRFAGGGVAARLMEERCSYCAGHCCHSCRLFSWMCQADEVDRPSSRRNARPVMNLHPRRTCVWSVLLSRSVGICSTVCCDPLCVFVGPLGSLRPATVLRVGDVSFANRPSSFHSLTASVWTRGEDSSKPLNETRSRHCTPHTDRTCIDSTRLASAVSP